MDNAVKALLMASAIFLGIMLFSIFVYLFRAGGDVNRQYDERQANNQLVLYNSKFELYDKSDNTIMDLITVLNLAYDVNEESDYDDGNSVEITINIGNSEIILPNEKNKVNKNQILKETDKISIYDLLEKTIDELSIQNVQKAESNDKLSTTKYKAGSTIYKYLFSCDDISYYDSTGKVSSMEFTIKFNPDFN